jgi:hypothetical protein
MSATRNSLSREVADPNPDLAADTLRGAEEIGRFLFGKPGQRRRVYHLVEKSRLPVFRLGSVLHARRSTLLAFFSEQEQRNWRRD